jgi:hypothetical protein
MSGMFALRFLDTLSQNSMIMRVGRSAGQEAGHFSVCNYETYNSPRDTLWDTQRDTFKEVFKEGIKKEIKDSHPSTFAKASAKVGACLSSKILFEIYQQNNQSLPEVKALTSERLKKKPGTLTSSTRAWVSQWIATKQVSIPSICSDSSSFS